MSAVLVPPPSKSDAQRALVLADITGLALPLDGELPGDVEILRSGLAALHGPEGTIDCRDGGAPFRFLLTQAALTPGHVTHFTGTPRLGERPHAPLFDALRAIPGLVITRGDPWPVTVRAPPRPDAPGFLVAGDESSQFASSLLLGAARVVAASGHPCSVRVSGALASGGYLWLTRRWVERAGFVVRALDGGPTHLLVERLSSPASLPPIPGDWSSLSYLLLLAWRHGARVANVERGTGHPDEALVEHLASVGLRLEGQVVTGAASGGLEVDAAVCPDAVPALVALACVLPRTSRFTRVGVLRNKESDRVEGLCDLVTRSGGAAHVDDATLQVTPGAPRDFAFDSRGDHRLAMAAATLASLAGVHVELEGAESVAKSFPGFWRELSKLR